MSTKITIIGFGIMGKAIHKEIAKKDRTIKFSTIDKDDKIEKSSITKSDFIILAVKPQNAPEVLEQIKNKISKKTILISVMAGFPIKRITKLSGHKKIIRMMPSLGLSVGSGVAVWKKVGLSKTESTRAKNLIDKITDNFEATDEDMIDKITPISGSGPAYFFLLASHMVRAGIMLGLTKVESRKLVEKTFMASALLAVNSDYSLLIEKIASKGGTTEAALKIFQEGNFDSIVLKALKAGYKRAKQLSRE